MSDVLLFHTQDGGDIEIVNGRVTMSSGLETAVYLSLFGGNERDSGLTATAKYQWWGNIDERIPERTYRSETQSLLRNLPLIPASLRRIEEGAKRDVAWMLGTVATSVDVTARMPTRDTVVLTVSVVVGDESFAFEFTRTP